MSNINPDSFCISAFTELRINGDGSFNFCHFAKGNGDKNERIDKMSIQQYFQARSTASEARLALDRGEFVARCQGCYDAEKQKIVSHRQRRNLQAAIFPGRDFLPSVTEYQSRDRSTLHYPRFYHISFSNLCNLSCMMCTPACSTRLDQDWRKAGLIQTPPVHHDWTTTKAWDEFCQHLLANPNIVCLHIMGGEPLYHKKFHDLIDFLITNNHTNFNLTFVTNGTIYPTDLIAKLKKFRSVAVEISIESVGTANQYIRYHSDTAQVMQNIKSFAAQQTKAFTVVLRTVPQALSVCDYADLLDFAMTNQLCVDSNVLTNPDFLKSNILPSKIKNSVMADLQRFRLSESVIKVNDINLRNTSRLKHNIALNAEFVIAQMTEPCSNLSVKQSQFIDFCQKLDQHRSLDLRDCVPALANFAEIRGYAPT